MNSKHPLFIRYECALQKPPANWDSTPAQPWAVEQKTVTYLQCPTHRWTVKCHNSAIIAPGLLFMLRVFLFQNGASTLLYPLSVGARLLVFSQQERYVTDRSRIRRGGDAQGSGILPTTAESPAASHTMGVEFLKGHGGSIACVCMQRKHGAARYGWCANEIVCLHLIRLIWYAQYFHRITQQTMDLFVGISIFAWWHHTRAARNWEWHVSRL